MIYLIWLLKMISSLLMKYLVAWPLTPLIVLFTDDSGNLPNWLSWFQTHDANMDAISVRTGKIDKAWAESRWFKIEDRHWKRYINRCGWIWRNSVYGYNHSVLAIPFNRYQKLAVFGDSLVTSSPKGKAGLVKRYLYEVDFEDEGKYKLIAWQWYLVKRFKNILKGRCLRVSIGYKLWSWDAWQKTKKEEIAKGHAAGSIGFQKFIT
ncbi:hypothetical protein [Caudoviricetes sp.]|nr:hypothetical protein [Caudoviricetes sp.]